MLKFGESALAGLVEAMSDAVLVLDRPGVIRVVNRRTATLFGYAGADLVGQSVETLVPEWFSRVRPGAGLVLTGRRRDGSRFPVDISSRVIDTEDGPVIIAAMSDTTDRDMAARLSAILESSHDAIVERSPEGVITGWNPAAQELYGYSYEEVIGKSVTILSPQDRVEEIEVTLAMVRTGGSVKPVESVRVRKDGTKVSVSLALTPVRDADGAVVGAYSIARDLSDRKKAELYARRMAAIVEGSNDGIIDSTLDGVITSWNPAAERMFGVSSQAVIGESLQALAAEERLEEIAGLVATVRAGEPTEPFERVCVRPDGTEAFLSLTVSPVKDAAGVIVGISAIVRDLTEKRRAELDARRMAAVIEGSNDAIVDATLDGVITSWNPAAERMFGIPSQDAIGKSFRSFTVKDRQEKVAAKAGKVSAGQPIEPYEVHFVRPDGTEVFGELVMSQVKDAGGVVVGISSIIRNLTASRMAEMEYRHMEAIIESSSDAIIGGTPEGVITSWNPAAERLYGYSREEAIGKSVLDLTPEDRLEESKGVLAKVRAGQTAGPLETVRSRKDGTQVFVSLSVQPFSNPHGAVMALTSIAHDVTGEKMAHRDVATWQRRALALTEDLERCQRLSAMRELANDIKLLDLQQANEPMSPRSRPGGVEPDA